MFARGRVVLDAFLITEGNSGPYRFLRYGYLAHKLNSDQELSELVRTFGTSRAKRYTVRCASLLFCWLSMLDLK